MGARPTRYAAPPAGHTRLWCRGACLTGPDYRGALLTLLLALLIFGAELGVAFPYLAPRHPALAAALLSTLALSFAAAVAAAYLAATTDPGIVPRSHSLPPSVVAFPAVRERKVALRGRSVTLRFCDTCRVWRPPRTSHCATCNNCVRRFDHHCPWLGNDIGLRNYRSYFAFVASASVGETIAIAASSLTLHLTVESFRPALGHAAAIRRALSTGPTAANLPLILLCFLALLFTGGLTGFHLYLMWNNVTTAESFKKRARNAAEPDDDLRGFSAIAHLQGARRPPSAVTAGFAGLRYPHEDIFSRLIDEQVALEQAVSVPARVANPAAVIATPEDV